MAKDLSEFPFGFDPEQYKKKAEELGSQVAESLNAGFVKGLYKTDVNVTRAFQTKYTSLKYQLEFGLISQEEYFSKLESIRDAYFSKNSQEWYKYTLEIYEYYETTLKESLEECAKIYSEEFAQIADGAEEMISRIGKARDAYEKKLYAYAGTGTGFDTDETIIHNYYPTGDPLVIVEYELSDLDKEIESLKAFNDTITALKERGESLDADSFRAFFEEIRTLSVEDANILANLLLHADDETFLEYLKAYREKKDLTGDIADALYADDFDIAVASIKTEIEQEFSEIPEEFFTYGERTAENFKAGFQAEIQTLFEDVAVLLGTYGLDTDLGIMANASNSTYAPTYHLYGSGESTTQQLITARSHAALEKLRNGIGT